IVEFGRGLVAFRDDATDRERIFARELEVALVVRGHAEHGAGAIVHQHEIGDVDRDFPSRIKGMRGGEAGIEAQLLLRLQLGRGGAALFAPLGERANFGVRSGQFLRDRMVRGHRDEARPENGVGPSRVDFDAVAVRKRPVELQALGLADPVLLHQLHLVRPMLERLDAGQQVVGEFGDLEEPLAELAPLDQRARTPAAPVDHLLVGEHGHVDRVPVDCRFLAIDQAILEEIEEDGLFVAIIVRLAGGELAGPVEREAQ
ncbi:hypothetical protein QU38_02905, partial [Staphylococcus aureus]